MAPATALEVRESIGGENSLPAAVSHRAQRRHRPAVPMVSFTSKMPCSIHRYW
jgi:hypothetical protein